jgi:hypothetical protein
MKPLVYLAMIAGLLLVPGTGAKASQEVTATNYDKATLTQWLAMLDTRAALEYRTKASNTFAQLGTNTLPFLMEELSALGKLQDTDLTNFQTSPPLLARLRNLTSAFQALGPAAQPVVPELSSMFNEGKYSGVTAQVFRGFDMSAAASICTAGLTNSLLKVRVISAGSLPGLWLHTNTALAGPAISNLRACMSYEGSDWDAVHLRTTSAMALGYIQLQPETVVPALIQRVKLEKDPVARSTAAASLGRFGSEARAAIPALRQATNDTEKVVSRSASIALKKIEP